MRALRSEFPPSREWCEAVRENIEVLTGRRENKLEMPPGLEVLTFSSPPTKAECEALDAKLNVVWGVVLQMAQRLDAKS